MGCCDMLDTGTFTEGYLNQASTHPKPRHPVGTLLYSKAKHTWEVQVCAGALLHNVL